jgi:hypothetical protein
LQSSIATLALILEVPSGLTIALTSTLATLAFVFFREIIARLD